MSVAISLKLGEFFSQIDWTKCKWVICKMILTTLQLLKTLRY